MKGQIFLLSVCLLVASTTTAAPQQGRGYSYPQPTGNTLEIGASTGSGSFISGGSHTSASGSSTSHTSSSSNQQSSAVASSSGHVASGGSTSFGGSAQVIAIVRDERVDPDETGAYSFTYETEDGITRTETGTADGPSGAVVQQGEFSWTLPDGELFTLKFVADENGYQPESSYLPPLPQYVLEQIAFAASEAQSASSSSSSSSGGSFAGSSGGSSSSSSVGESHAASGSSSGQGSVAVPSNSYITPRG